MQIDQYIRLSDYRKYWNSFQYHSLLLNELWSQADIKTSIESLPERIYVERKSSNNFSQNRKVVNTKERDIFLRKYGFRIVCMEDISVNTEVNLFRNAEIVIAVEGAALFNIIHMKPDSIVIALHHNKWHDNSFTKLSKIRNVVHHYVTCSSPYSQLEEDEMIAKGGKYFRMPIICNFKEIENILF